MGLDITKIDLQEVEIPEGKRLLEDVCELTYLPEDLQEGEGKRPYLKGRLGLTDQATANRRLYPRKLMARELERLQEDMKARKVFGELDHPCLTSNDFRVLTVEGWKEFRDVKVGDHVWSRQNGKSVVSDVTVIIDEPYDGPAYRMHGRGIDSTFTPAHGIMLVKRPDRNNVQDEVLVPISEISEHPERYAHHAIPKTSEWFVELMPQVRISGIDAKRLASCKNDVSKDLVLDAPLFSAFMGIYLSEGYCSSDSVDNYDVVISQKTPWSKKFIWDEVLSKFPDELKWREIDKGFALSDARLYFYLKELGDAYSKHIPSEVKRLDADCLRELVFWFCIGDGRMVAADAEHRRNMVGDAETTKEAMAVALREGVVPFTRRDVFSVSERLIRDLHECVVRSGGAGSISHIDPNRDYQFAGRTILAENKVPLYQMHICQSGNIWMDPRFIEIDRVDHRGNIYCLSTTNGSFYMEMGGHAFWTGNSDGKTKLARVSHLVTDAVIESNGEIKGIIEFIPGTINGDQALAIARVGGKLGVSSRGFGSTSTDSKGNDVVQEDYKLVTWDIVADPANAGAHPEFVMEDKEIKNMDLNTLKKEHPELVEALMAEVSVEARTHAREALRSEFEEQLRTEAKAIREEAVEKARSELLDDPEVAGSATAIERIKEVVAPFIVSEDEFGEVAKLKKQIAATEKRLADADESRDKAVEEAKELSSICKELGFHLYLEREHRDNDRLEQITELLGDVTQYSDLDEFKGRVSEISEALSEEDKVHEEYEMKISALQKEKGKLEEERNKALLIGKQLGIRAYVERKIADNPRSRQLREYLEESAPEDKEDVDSLVSTFNKANPPSEDYLKIRKGIEKKSRTKLTEDGSDRSNGLDRDVLGVPMRELVARAIR